MAWLFARPLFFLIDCWQFEGGLFARVAKYTPQPLTTTPCKFFAFAAYYLMEALRPGRMSSPGIAEPTEAIARAKGTPRLGASFITTMLRRFSVFAGARCRLEKTPKTPPWKFL
jgi:hypothetical protein